MDKSKLRQIIREEIQNLNENIVKDIINSGELKYRIATQSSGISNPSKADIKKLFTRFMTYYFFDDEFYREWCDRGEKEEYKNLFFKEFVNKNLKNMNKFYEKYLTNEPDWEGRTELRMKDEIRLNNEKHQDEIIRKSKTISTGLRRLWNQYRWKRWGVKADPKRYKYVGDKVIPK